MQKLQPFYSTPELVCPICLDSLYINRIDAHFEAVHHINNGNCALAGKKWKFTPEIISLEEISNEST